MKRIFNYSANVRILFVISHMMILVGVHQLAAGKKKPSKKPNIIYLLADDAGYGDFGCYGQEKFTTPNIDKLAASGMKFTQHYSGSTVCAPSRSALLTGQHTGHTPIRGNLPREGGGEGQPPLPKSSITIAEMLKKEGYTTGAFGKWGLGFPRSEGDPINQGFDEFYGYNCQAEAHRYYPNHLWYNFTKVDLPNNTGANPETYSQDLIQEKTLEFIDKNKDEPFFLYVPFVVPHAELIAPDDTIYQKFKGKFPEEKPFEGKPGAAYGSEDFLTHRYAPQAEPRTVFAAMMFRMDVYVGQIMDKLKELGIEDNTIVMFASDNGPHNAGGGDPKFFNSNGGFRGIKRDLYEGGVRTAFIASWPDKIKAGQTSDHMSSFWDVMPTLADIADSKTPKYSDGISFLPTLLGKGDQKTHEYLYWEFYERGGKIAVRKDQWKGIILKAKNPDKARFELYNLEVDPKEKNNIANENPEIVAELKSIMKSAHIDNESYQVKIN